MKNDTEILKRCTDCDQEKPTSEFYAHPRGRDGLFSRCKRCHRAEVSANRKLKHTYYMALQADYRARVRAA